MEYIYSVRVMSESLGINETLRVAARNEGDALAQAVDYYGFKEYRLNGTLAELDCRFFIWSSSRQSRKKIWKKVKKRLDNPGIICYNRAILERGGRKMEYFEIHGGEWEELQALLREEE